MIKLFIINFMLMFFMANVMLIYYALCKYLGFDTIKELQLWGIILSSAIIATLFDKYIDKGKSDK